MTAARDVIYLDNNATTPVDPEVLEAMMPYFTSHFGNAASSQHEFGWEAAGAVDRARKQVAGVLGARADEIVLTSGATESINLALKGAVEASDKSPVHVVTVTTEHKATLDAVHWLERQGHRVTVLPVQGDGLLDLAAFESCLADDTRLASIMIVNNENGVVQPIADIGALCRDRGIIFHCDAAQGFGKLPIDVGAMNVDLLSLSAHKFYGPKGVGALYCRGTGRNVRVIEQIHGGGHEGGRRSGTLNVPGIVGLGAAAEKCRRVLPDEHERVVGLRDRLRRRIESELDGVHLNGSAEHRVAGNLSLSFDDVEGAALLLGIEGLAVSSGSACNTASIEPSYVLTAMGLSTVRAEATLRFGVGRFNTPDEIDRAADIVVEAVGRLRSKSR